MTRYSVNATMTVMAWISVEADSEEEALEEARQHDARDFDYDMFGAEVDFNIEPAVEVES